MSDSDLHRALWATARVAGLGAVIACAPRAGVVIPEVPTTTSTDDVATDDTDVFVDEEPVCADLLADLADAYEDGEDVTSPDEDTALCCDDVLAEINESGTWPDTPEEQRAHWACCTALGWPGGLACTPWGPPAPPSMPSLRAPVGLA